MVRHIFGYSKSTRAKCYGPPPCNGSMAVGTLRYGQVEPSEFGETVKWSHWDCASPLTLRELAASDLENLDGFQELRNSDKQKIRLAIARGRIDVPGIAKPVASPAATSALNPAKRKIGEAEPFEVGCSQPPASQREEAEEDTPSDEEAKDELYCAYSTKVVGIQYYRGMVGPGEEVLLVREPQNPYDRNSIQVKNITQIQVGHLPRQVALKLAPLLDRRAVTVEGVINDGNLSGAGYSLSITLKIYGPVEKRIELEPHLTWATPGQRGFPKRSAASVSAGPPPPSQRPQVSRVEDAQKAVELRQIIDNLEKVDDDGRRSSLLDSLCSNEDILNLPLHPSPPSIESGELLTNLLKHQCQALQWCIGREYPVLPKSETDRPVQFWQLRKHGSKIYYFNIATKTPQESPPLLGRGALFADAMGLGKTLTMLALTLATKNDVPPDYSKTTLIIVPLSVLSNWEQQIQDHCAPGTIEYIVYHGSNRSFNSQELAKYDVVITTYQTVSGEYTGDSTNGQSGPSKKRKKSEKTLFGVQWKRIILDEGHTIRNSKTKTSKAICALNAQRRWILSGTPIVNSPNDLGSLLAFLQICQPLDNEDFFKRLLLRPLRYGRTEGAELLRALMSQICIRRTKEMQDSQGNPLIILPPVEMIRVPVTLNDEARRLYDKVEAAAQQRLTAILNEGMALHPGLVPRGYVEELQSQGTQKSLASRTPLEISQLRQVLAQAIEDCEECPICLSLFNEPRITSCSHMYCLSCIREVISRDQRCPMDRRPLGMGDLYEPPPPTEFTQPCVAISDVNNELRDHPSAKIEQLIHLLKLLPSTDKSLVFSQFTSFMDKIAEAFEEEGISYVRFDGQMSAKRRQEAIARFVIPVENSVQSSTIPAPTKKNIRPTRQSVTKHQRVLNDEDSVTESDSDFSIANLGEQTEDEDNVSNRKGKGKAKDESTYADDMFCSGDNPRVMLISLKAGALGLNLTVANNVFLMDPWWQEGIESQAVDRVNRIGQRKPVHIYQLIAENTVESKVLEIQDRKKNLIKQAFSGIKGKETQRQQREARLQDLIELFRIPQH
ncbi:SNF2 family N-terminal domain-containing protein [Amanita rubescens]|nr:SNF2 family N-terminal domain-containing protein [Amanita rubescens]